jgi:hypothetical protein
MTEYNIVATSMFLCILAALAVVVTLRRERLSLGLPFAYILLLMLEHLPGAWAAITAEGAQNLREISTGIMLTALAATSFAVGVWGSCAMFRSRRRLAGLGLDRMRPIAFAPPLRFLLFCLIGGWVLTFAGRAIVDIPSFNAVIEKGAGLWLLSVMLGLSRAVHERSLFSVFLWFSALLVYPAFVLIVGGFMSWGALSIGIAVSTLVVTVKRAWTVILGIVVASVLGVSLFVNYFEHRSDLRAVAWSGGAMESRLDVATRIFTDFKLLDPSNPAHLDALDQRLNQNYFIGVAADRLDRGAVEFLNGRSVVEGLLSLVPRVVWPNKPVFGGSGRLVPDMTGLPLNEETAWGIGSVMEFYVNFGAWGIVCGFLGLGWLIGRLDRLAADRLRSGQLGGSLIFFLPCAALIQPLGSFVELTGGAAAALLAAFVWRWLWQNYSATSAVSPTRGTVPK